MLKLNEDRKGEICNACVLLVKRWKKLPVGSQRNWEHVVDARAGHGSKPLSKINKVKKNKLKLKPIKGKLKQEIITDDRENNFDIPIETAERMKKKLYIPKINRKRVSSPSGFSDDIQLECLSSGSGSYHSSPIPSPLNVEVDEDSSSNCISSSQMLNNNNNKGESGQSRTKRRRGKVPPQKNRSSMSSFLDLTFWKREKTCCGIIFKGPFGEILLDRRYLNPCCRSNPSSLLPSPEFESVPLVKADCFAIDSYEDSSSSNKTIEAFRMLANVSTNSKDPKVVVGSYVSNYTLKVD